MRSLFSSYKNQYLNKSLRIVSNYLTFFVSSFAIIDMSAEQSGRRTNMKHNKRIMVCVTQQKSCERLIDYGVKLVTNDADELHVIHVVKENWKYFGQLEEKDALDYLFEVSKTNNAMLTVTKAKDIELALAQFAEKNKITDIIMGESLERSEQQNMINRLQDQTTKSVRFCVVPLDFEDEPEVLAI